MGEAGYSKIYLLGTGTLFLECLAYVKSLGIEYAGYDTGEEESPVTKIRAQKQNLQYFYQKKTEVLQILRKETKKTLLLSVINPWILPEDILKKKNILSINIHQALLPAHKGRNAEAWSIYEGDTVSGITWHKMTAKVDGGEILMQKEIALHEKITSFQLFRQQLKVAYEAFEEFMPKVLEGKEKYIPQKSSEALLDEMKYSWQIPAEGILDLQWPEEKISRFLRAMDYGILKVMPQPKLFIKGRMVKINSWKIKDNMEENQEERMEEQEDCIILWKKKYCFILKKI